MLCLTCANTHTCSNLTLTHLHTRPMSLRCEVRVCVRVCPVSDTIDGHVCVCLGQLSLYRHGFVHAGMSSRQRVLAHDSPRPPPPSTSVMLVFITFLLCLSLSHLRPASFPFSKNDSNSLFVSNFLLLSECLSPVRARIRRHVCLHYAVSGSQWVTPAGRVTDAQRATNKTQNLSH